MLNQCRCNTAEEYMKDELVSCVKTLFAKGYVSSGGGNHSFRYNNLIWITPSGYPRSHLRSKDLVLIDIDGRVIEGDLKPSIEVPFHTEIYKVRSDINAVSHTHSPYSHAMVQASILIERDEGIFDIKEQKFIPRILGNIPVLEYRQLGSRALARLVGKASIDSKVMILLDHGVIGIGKCIHEAVFYIQLLEESARCMLVEDIFR